MLGFKLSPVLGSSFRELNAHVKPNVSPMRIPDVAPTFMPAAADGYGEVLRHSVVHLQSASRRRQVFQVAGLLPLGPPLTQVTWTSSEHSSRFSERHSFMTGLMVATAHPLSSAHVAVCHMSRCQGAHVVAKCRRRAGCCPVIRAAGA